MKFIDRKFFFDTVRKTVFGGTLSAEQVFNLSAILQAIESYGIEKASHVAAILATAYIEVGRKMAPVREGFAKTDIGARRAVADLYAKGKIKKNYAVPAGPYGNSYYGRGFVQLSHLENYTKTGNALGLDLVKDPDLMLQTPASAAAMVWGMKAGAYRKGKSLFTMLPDDVATPGQFFEARDIVNGDKNKHRYPKVKVGDEYAKFATKFQSAIKWMENGITGKPKVIVLNPGKDGVIFRQGAEVPEKPPLPLDTPPEPAYKPLTTWEKFKMFFSKF